MAREWALAGVSKEELEPVAHLEPPKTPRGKWQNFWYHYKWHVVAVVFVLVVVGVCTWQILTRNPPDYRLVLITQDPVSQTAADYLGSQLTAYGEDLDEDGTVEVQVEPLYLDDSGANYAAGTANSQKISAYLASGDVMFFAMEPSYYEERLRPALSDGFEFFATLPTEAPLTDEGRLWDWAGSPLQTNAVFQDAMPQTLLFGVRTVEGSATLNKDSKDANEASLALLVRLIEAMTAS